MITPEQLAASGTEDGHQAALFCWAALASVRSRYPQLALMFAIPNGGQRSKATAGRLKATGVKAGVPDVFLPVSRGDFCGLFIELKRPKSDTKRKGVISDVQTKWHDGLSAQGYRVVTCYGYLSAVTQITDYLEGDDE